LPTDIKDQGKAPVTGNQFSDVRNERYLQGVFRSLGAGDGSLLNALALSDSRFPPNRPLIQEGEIGTCIFRIVSGWAYQYRTTHGRRQIVDFLLPGEIAGLEGALLGLTEHSVRALTELRVTVFDGRLAHNSFRAAPELALRLGRHIAAQACRIGELLATIGCCDAIERLAFLMLSLYRRQARRGEATSPLQCWFPLRRRHMAETLGMTGAHINRTLNQLRREGIAAVENERLIIQDFSRLARIAGGAAAASVP